MGLMRWGKRRGIGGWIYVSVNALKNDVKKER